MLFCDKKLMSCLFQSLSNSVVQCEIQTLRNKICDYLAGNPKLADLGNCEEVLILLQDESMPIPLDNYVENMRHAHTMGGAIEIMCFVQMFKTNVVVIDKRSGHKMEFHYFQDYTIDVVSQDKETSGDSTTVLQNTSLQNTASENVIHLNWNGGHFDRCVVL